MEGALEPAATVGDERPVSRLSHLPERRQRRHAERGAPVGAGSSLPRILLLIPFGVLGTDPNERAFTARARRSTGCIFFTPSGVNARSASFMPA